MCTRGVGSLLPTPQPPQHQIRAMSLTYTTAHSNAGSLTHWAKPGIEPTSSWTLCWVLNPLSHNGNSGNILSYISSFSPFHRLAKLHHPNPSQVLCGWVNKWTQHSEASATLSHRRCTGVSGFQDKTWRRGPGKGRAGGGKVGKKIPASPSPRTQQTALEDQELVLHHR